MRSVLSVHWKDWFWSWNSSTLATWWEVLTHWKRPWCWERLKAGGERDDRGWNGWMASPTQWTWVWVNSGSYWWTGRPGILQFMGLQRVRHDWVTELNWRSKKFRLRRFKILSLWIPAGQTNHIGGEKKIVNDMIEQICLNWEKIWISRLILVILLWKYNMIKRQ